MRETVDFSLLSLWHSVPGFIDIEAGHRKGYKEQMIYGFSGSLDSFIVAALFEQRESSNLIVVNDLKEAERLASDLRVWVPDEQVFVFPPLEVLPYEVFAYGTDLIHRRLEVMQKLISGDKILIVAPAGALSRRLIPMNQLASAYVTIKWGQSLALEELVGILVQSGYERTELVESRGQFSQRGGILDIYPLGNKRPVRIEFFGDEVDSIRSFDTESQTSIESLSEIVIGPARELVITQEAVSRANKQIAIELAQMKTKIDSERYEALEKRVNNHWVRLENEGYFEGIERYAPYFYSNMYSLIDYLPEDSVVFISEPIRLMEELKERDARWMEHHTYLLADGKLLPSEPLAYLNSVEIVPECRRRTVIYLSRIARNIASADIRNIWDVGGRPAIAIRAQWAMLKEEVKRWKEGRYRVLLLTATEERQNRIRDILEDEDIIFSKSLSELEASKQGKVVIGEGVLSEGFEIPALRLAVLGDQEIFGQVKRKRISTYKTKDTANKVSHWTELNQGDYVVHVQHGIGRFLGMRTMEVQGANRDYMVLQYAGEDRLYVPIEQIELVQRYVGAEGKKPKLYRLGGSDWNKVKQRVKESLRDMAEELLALYAAREKVEGFQYPEDGPWQAEFEDAFPFEETVDQLQSIAEIKGDMQKSRPMDRLLCGDVGYGKTEVAIRAAFKAVMSGKQVVVLVPTTILAQQHYLSFSQRFASYPVNIGVLSRFRSKEEQEKTLTGLRTGEVDIVIGTHRIVQGDIGFKNLGLLIIDEEHRFGVAQKERLKQLKTNVDVLTLTATPIPRTLHMALTKVRDMSVIETPPENRFPVQTYVVEYSDNLVYDAIRRELSRGGQVYYVHNRVRSIRAVANRLQTLLPDARILVAHGQMVETELEKVMLAFIRGEYDVLLATTIIESGIDIPNANTMIIEDADRMGLAQLYQLRGRVGRSDKLAYAYFTYRKNKVLSEVAEKRLQAIKEFTELGSGFKLAMRDLEIRGAGNILGPEQHGYIVEVGFDLYTQLLEETVLEVKGEKKVPQTEPVIDLPVDAFISSEYIRDSRQKMEIYKKINRLKSIEETDELADELLDRYGDIPLSVENLLSIAKLRVYARELGILSVNAARKGVEIQFLPMQKELVQRSKVTNVTMSYGNRVVLTWKPEQMDKAMLASGLLAVLEEISTQWRLLINSR